MLLDADKFYKGLFYDFSMTLTSLYMKQKHSWRQTISFSKIFKFSSPNSNEKNFKNICAAYVAIFMFNVTIDFKSLQHFIEPHNLKFFVCFLNPHFTCSTLCNHIFSVSENICFVSHLLFISVLLLFLITMRFNCPMKGAPA